MSKEENVIKFYVLCNRLKNLIRTGWKDWNVQRERLESVAEHVYSTQMLALAIYKEYQYDIDIKKVLMMLAIHEIGETVIGDLTQFQISKEEKEKIEHAAVHNILSGLLNSSDIESLYLEFDERKTTEALFSYHCDKLECDLQAKLYGEDGCVDLTKQEDNKSFYDANVQRLLEKEKTWEKMWLSFGQEKYGYDENFLAISNFAKDNEIERYR